MSHNAPSEFQRKVKMIFMFEARIICTFFAKEMRANGNWKVDDSKHDVYMQVVYTHFLYIGIPFTIF